MIDVSIITQNKKKVNHGFGVSEQIVGEGGSHGRSDKFLFTVPFSPQKKKALAEKGDVLSGKFENTAKCE